jgi:hypothetical protein
MQEKSSMAINWSLYIALALLLLKLVYKLYLYTEPDRIAYLKAVAAFPIDISFLVVSLFIRKATQGVTNHDEILGMILIYLIISAFTTVLWRVCDKAVTQTLGKHFLWAFPLNAALAGTTFYFALNLLR